MKAARNPGRRDEFKETRASLQAFMQKYGELERDSGVVVIATVE